MALHYYIQARELLGPLVGTRIHIWAFPLDYCTSLKAHPYRYAGQNSYYQDMYTRVNNRVIALGGMPGYYAQGGALPPDCQSSALLN